MEEEEEDEVVDVRMKGKPVAVATRIIKLKGNYSLFMPGSGSDEEGGVKKKSNNLTSIFSSGLVFKRGAEINRISDLTAVPSQVFSTQQKVMHYLHNLNFVMLSDVIQLNSTYKDDWERIVQLMNAFSMKANSVIEGSTPITN